MCVGPSVLDINYVEESVGAPELTIAMLPRSEKLVALEVQQKGDTEGMQTVDSLPLSVCVRVCVVGLAIAC